jgi:hypothetical protein
MLPTLTAEQFETYRRYRTWNLWLRPMHDTGCTVPTASAGGVSVCFCGQSISLRTYADHVQRVHSDLR